MPTRIRNLKKQAATTKKAEAIVVVEAIIRVSKVGDRGGDSFLSPEQQRTMIQGYCDSRGWIIRQWHDETDVSGGTTDRVGLQAALEACYAGRSQAIVVARVDRLCRNLSEGLQTIKDLRAQGKAFVSVKEGITGDTEGFGGIMLTLLLMFAEWQLETITANWIDTRVTHIANGVAQVAPYGYEKNKTTRKLVPVPEQAKWVRHIYRQRAAGKKWTEIAADLTDQNVPTATGGSTWTHNQIANIVHNRTYLGELRSGEDIVNLAAHPAIITPDLWDKANSIIHTPKPKKASDVFILAGIVRCGNCGSRMSGKTTVQGDRRYRRYRCRKTFSWGRCPHPVEVHADELEALVLERFASMYWNVGLEQLPNDDFVDTAEVEAAVIAAEWDLNQYMTSPAVKKVAAANFTAFELGMDDRVRTLDAAKAALAKLTNGRPVYRPAENIESFWSEMTDEDRRQVYSAGLACIVVWSGIEHGNPGPVVDRVKIFGANERNAPTGLPAKGAKGNAITPIERV